MSKVSKTIKKLRVAQGLTQDALAEKLFVARQTVSSWENDRTQPDIEMLKMLSDIFGVSVEELIYGEKRRTDPNAENDKTRKILTTVFAVLASALVGVGLVLIFVAGWENFPIALKTVFAFVPMLAGQAAALYTYIKRRNSVSWREGASVLMLAGIAGTVAMIDSIFSLKSDFLDCMLIDALLILPVIYLLDVAAPLVFYYATALYYGFSLADMHGWPMLFLALVLLLPGLGYVILNRKKTEDMRHIYTVWLTVCSAAVFAALCSNSISESFFNFFVIITMAFIGIYALDREERRNYPFKTIGSLGTAVISAIAVYQWQPVNPDYYLYDWRSTKQYNTGDIVLFLIIAVLCVACIIIGRNTFKGDIPKIIFCLSAALCAVTEFYSIIFGLVNTTPIYIILFALTFVQAISLVIKGTKELSFIPLNAGLIIIGVLLFYIIYGFEVEMFGIGMIFVVLGAILFFINYRTAKKVRIKKETENNA